MIIGIDASNIKAGGGLQHLCELLNHSDPLKHNFTEIIIWGGDIPLDLIVKKKWITAIKVHSLNSGYFRRFFWQQFRLHHLARARDCDLLFFPGGVYLGKFKPFVVMYQNMQIFDDNELARERYSLYWLRLKLLKCLQAASFKRSDGLICLSNSSRLHLFDYFRSDFKVLNNVVTIEHGGPIIPDEFFKKNTNNNNSVKILYVSTIKQYKHQWNVVDAVSQLKLEGFNLELHLVGGGDAPAIRRLMESIKRAPKNMVYYHGDIPHEMVLQFYLDSNIFVFASTCETFGIALLEAMAVGMPIACSTQGSVSELLKDAGIYFNPEDVTSISNSLRILLKDETLRLSISSRAKSYSTNYSWERCSNETFNFLNSLFTREINK